MAEAFYVAGYWGPRSEPVSDCAARLARFLDLLGGIDPLLASWFELGNSPEAARTSKVEPNTHTLERLLSAGRPRRDDADRSVMTDLGFLLSLWNGNDTSSVGLTARCGGAPRTMRIGNSVGIELPAAEGEGARLYQRNSAINILRALVSCWEPSWATWTSHHLRNMQEAKPGEVVVGWATYLAHPNSLRLELLPAGVSAEPMHDGVLITVGDDPASVPESLLVAARSALGDAVHRAW